MQMLVKIQNGVGDFGKLWTGDKPESGEIMDAVIIQRCCRSCTATTRKFRATPVLHTPEVLDAIDLPLLYVTAGGVGSIRTSEELMQAGLACHNWSGRPGGHAILAPVAVMSGYVDYRELPPAKPGFSWHQTYGGITLAEYVLLRDDLLSHALPLVTLAGECPPCVRARENQQAGDTALVPQQDNRDAMQGNFACTN